MKEAGWQSNRLAGIRRHNRREDRDHLQPGKVALAVGAQADVGRRGATREGTPRGLLNCRRGGLLRGCQDGCMRDGTAPHLRLHDRASTRYCLVLHEVFDKSRWSEFASTG